MRKTMLPVFLMITAVGVLPQNDTTPVARLFYLFPELFMNKQVLIACNSLSGNLMAKKDSLFLISPTYKQ